MNSFMELYDDPLGFYGYPSSLFSPAVVVVFFVAGGGPLDRRRDPSPSAYPPPPPPADSRTNFGEVNRNNNLYSEEHSGSPRLRQRRRGGRGRRLDTQLSGRVGAGEGSVQWARTEEQAWDWGVPLDAMPPEFTGGIHLCIRCFFLS